MDGNTVPTILQIAIYTDCPLTSFRLSNIATNNTDIIRFCPKAAYIPFQSSNSWVIVRIKPKLKIRDRANAG